MQHRITLSTDLLIAVRDKYNETKELRIRPSVEGIIIAEQKFERHIAPYMNETQFNLYGHEHAEAV